MALILERLIAIILFRSHQRKTLRFLNSKGEEGKPFLERVTREFFLLEMKRKEEILEDGFQFQINRFTLVIDLIAGVGGVAPLLGFIGTVSGMIGSFQTIASADKVSVKLVAAGISEALITTGFGLIIAVVCLLAEHILRFILSQTAHAMELELNDFLEREEAENAL